MIPSKTIPEGTTLLIYSEVSPLVQRADTDSTVDDQRTSMGVGRKNGDVARSSSLLIEQELEPRLVFGRHPTGEIKEADREEQQQEPVCDVGHRYSEKD